MDLSNLDKMKVVDLRNELQARGLDTKGVKAVLIERLRAHLEGGSAGVPPSPGTPSRRSRRTRSMTKSPSPLHVKKVPESILVTLKEESIPSSICDEHLTNEEKLSTPEISNQQMSDDSTPSKEESENKYNSSNEENCYIIAETSEEKESAEEHINGNAASSSIVNNDEEPKCVDENSENLEKTEIVEENEKPIGEERNQEDNEERSEAPDKGNEDVSPKKTKSLSESSQMHSDDRSERRKRTHSDNRSKSRSRSRSRSPHHKSQSRSRSPKHRSGAGSLGSPSKEAEDTSTPEDEPSIEENQFGLSWFDSDLHLRIDPVTFTSAKPMSHDIYALVWSGARTNYGVREGKICFEVRLSEETNLSREHPFRDEPYTKGFRVGFSMPSSNLLLGESENSFAYCESGRKATNAEFIDFAKSFKLDDVIGCYLDLESTPCTIKYTLNGEDLGVAFEFDKAILGENEALYPHILTKGYEYEVNFADSDNLLVNAERKVRKRRKVKEIHEKKEQNENKVEDENIPKNTVEEMEEETKKEEPMDDINMEELQKSCESQEETVESATKSQDNKEKPEDVEKCEENREDQESTENNVTAEGDTASAEDKIISENCAVDKVVEKEHTTNIDEKPCKDKNCGPSPVKRGKIEPVEEDEYEEIHPEHRDHMSLLEDYELIALIPEEKYISGPQRPESRKECEVILMVGLPGVGKTTWVLNHIKENPTKRYHVIGADALIAKMTIDGASRKSVHKGRFDRIYELCFNVLTSLEDIAVKRRRNFILDQANAYASAQRRKMKGFADFKRIAVVCIPNEEEVKRRLADKKEKGHAFTLKESTLNTLQAAFTLPSLEFGWFDDIIYTDLGADEAKEEVKKYNEKGKKALDETNANREKRQRRDGYRNDNRRRQDDRHRYDNRMDNRWGDRRQGGGGGGGYYHGGNGPAGGVNRWGGGGGGGYRNNSGGYRDDRGYGGGAGGGGRAYDNRNQRFGSGPQNWMQNNRNRYDDRSNRNNSGGGGRYDPYGANSRDYRGGGGDQRDHRDRNRGGNSGAGGSSRRDGHRSGANNNQRDFRHGHRDTREDSRGGSSATSAIEASSKESSNSVAGGYNGGYDKYNKNQPQANNWMQYPQHQPVAVNQQPQQYWNYDTQGYGNQQQWQSMDPQQQQQWMCYWQQQAGAQQIGSSTSDPNQYWSQYSYNTSTDATKK